MFNSVATGIPVYSEQEVHIRSDIAVCVTGHRERAVIPYKGDPENLDITRTAVRMMLGRYIDIVMKKGYTTLLSGLAEGTDLWAADHVLKRKRYSKETRLIGVMPFLEHCSKFSAESMETLRLIERFADLLITTNNDPNITYGKIKRASTDPNLYRTRNRYLVENSSIMIAFYNSSNLPYSGTGQTVRLARQAEMPILSFGIDDVYELLDRTGTDKIAIYEELESLRLNVPKPSAIS